MANRVPNLTPSRSVVNENGGLDQSFQLWTQLLTERATIISTGSPEGVIQASQGALYIDTDGITGSILYVKKLGNISGDVTQGWVLV